MKQTEPLDLDKFLKQKVKQLGICYKQLLEIATYALRYNTQESARIRWSKTTKEQRLAHSKKMSAARWPKK